MTREEAFQLLKKNIKNKNLVNHCVAAEVVMKKLAQHLGEDEEKWALAGLLHDIDYEETKAEPERHSAVGAEMLTELGLPQDIVYAVKVHNERHGLPRQSLMDKALYATDPTTGFIVAGALIKPEKKLSAIDVNFLLKKMKEKSFAKGASRDQMRTCDELDLSIEEFLGLSLLAMQDAAEELGL